MSRGLGDVYKRQAMHSAVETASVADAEAMTKAVAAFYRVHLRALGDGTYTLA